MPVLNLLQKNLLQKSKGLTEICESNKYTIQFILKMADLKRAKSSKQSIENSSESEIRIMNKCLSKPLKREILTVVVFCTCELLISAF